jgi:hypothetical protein
VKKAQEWENTKRLWLDQTLKFRELGRVIISPA